MNFIKLTHLESKDRLDGIQVNWVDGMIYVNMDLVNRISDISGQAELHGNGFYVRVQETPEEIMERMGA
ncbi:MAG: hypothetical protein GY718_09970 [Lentisphaerae bacterium]|nr:hypothetical protein [Lentisphaerota bacterium]